MRAFFLRDTHALTGLAVDNADEAIAAGYQLSERSRNIFWQYSEGSRITDSIMRNHLDDWRALHEPVAESGKTEKNE